MVMEHNRPEAYDFSPTNVEYGIGAYHFVWSDIYDGDLVFPVPWYLDILVTRFLEDSKQNVTAELAVKDSDKMLHRARVNLTSSASRRSFIKELPLLYESLDWTAIIRYVCDMALDKCRQGEPVIRIGKAKEIPPLEYMLYPLILKNEHNILFGDGGTGKSYMACLISILIQCNVAHLGLLPQAGNVLVLDWETSIANWERRINAIKKGLGINDEAFFYRFCSQPLVNEIDEIQQFVVENDIALVITDSAGLASGIEGEFHMSALRYARALRQLRTTVLSIDHIAKNEGDKPFGSVYKTNIARSAYKIKHSQNPGDSDLYVGLYHHKMNDGPKHKPIGFHIHFEGDEFNLEKVTFETIDIASIAELASALPLRDQVKGLLGYGPKSVDDIAEELDRTKASILTILYRNKDMFIRIGEDWALRAFQGDDSF